MTQATRVDVVVVGGGAAGIAAGIEAADAGARVLVVEQFEEPGGTAILSGGGCLVVQSPVQERSGIRDSPDLAFDDWIAWGGSGVDQIWARKYVEHSLHDVYLWAERNGVEWSGVVAQEGNSVPRWTHPERGGFSMMRALITAYRQRGGELRTDTRVTRLVAERGRVRGVEGVAGTEGWPVRIEADAVVLATGGFASNVEMVLEQRPDLSADRILVGSGRGATGSGHRLVADVGGHLTHMDEIWFYAYAMPDPTEESPRHGFVFRNTPGNIWVNPRGERFHNEFLSGGKTATPAVFAQGPPHCWAVLDASMLPDVHIADPHYQIEGLPDPARVAELFETSPYIARGDSWEELAIAMQVPVEALVSTVGRYNSAFAVGLEHEPEFDKPLGQSRPLEQAPFYAIQMHPLARKTLGGIKTDVRCRVLDRHFDPLDGLYAAGEAAGMAGGHINGSAALEGTMLGPSLFSGRVAGAWAAYDAGCGAGFVGTPTREWGREGIGA